MSGYVIIIVSQIIVLDTDLIFNADIKELWQYFDKFNDSQAIGMAEELTAWYLNHGWPADKNGYNSGVMLLNLQKLRQMDWFRLWRAELLAPIIKLDRLELADQDVFNLMGVVRPDILYKLPCQWNRQWLPSRTRCKNDKEDAAAIKILHWNRQNKYIFVKELPVEIANLEDKIGGFY